MTDRPKLDAAGIEEFRQRAWDIMREDDYNDANAICDLALRGLAQQEAPQGGIERAREFMELQQSICGIAQLMAAYAASEVSRVRRETLLLAAKGCCWTDRTAIMKLLDGQATKLGHACSCGAPSAEGKEQGNGG